MPCGGIRSGNGDRLSKGKLDTTFGGDSRAGLDGQRFCRCVSQLDPAARRSIRLDTDPSDRRGPLPDDLDLALLWRQRKCRLLIDRLPITGHVEHEGARNRGRLGNDGHDRLRQNEPDTQQGSDDQYDQSRRHW